MSDHADSVPPRVANTVTGEVGGNVVMAGAIHGGVHFQLPARSAASLPYRYGATPLRAASFQSRTIDTEHAAVLASDRTISTSVLSGLGGVGKTQLALDYAETVWGRVRWSCWRGSRRPPGTRSWPATPTSPPS